MLAIPVAVGIGAAWYTAQQGKVSERENIDNQRETALQAYNDKISELLLHEQLGESVSNPKVESIARARTVTVLRMLDSVRRGNLIRFLSQTSILPKCIEHNLEGIDLSRTELTGVNLSKINLADANLTEAILDGSNLSGAYLVGADLGGADLVAADLTGAYISFADLSEDEIKEAMLPYLTQRGFTLIGGNPSAVREGFQG